MENKFEPSEEFKRTIDVADFDIALRIIGNPGLYLQIVEYSDEEIRNKWGEDAVNAFTDLKSILHRLAQIRKNISNGTQTK